ncbi:collagen-like protein [Sphingomonas desiccabilis]|uniref:Collagen-like protein n=1 Tax=Sphingomonas desiccabilis TaxID=429134 RepID=A0A4Q2IZD6_9SPHN|nr:collagen-like protein [Sphingomonas desiccabilis]MBB3910169.1 hypothetical protein [Sphingomonas desiccabilis]RXZ34848.1 collagen-like protein [Sphingomonas desiccabilis]
MADFPAASFYGQGQNDLRGPKGDKGDKGDQGPPGPRGEQGIQGLTGPAGTDGTDGIDGTDGRAGKDSQYRYGAFAVAGIQAAEILMDHPVIEGHVLGADFAGSAASCGIPPNDMWLATVSKNDEPIGTLTITPMGACTLGTLGHLPVTVSAGDVISVVAPDEPDMAIGRVRFTFAGQL